MKCSPLHLWMIQPKLSVLPRVGNSSLRLAFLSFIPQTLLSSPNPPPFCHPSNFPLQLPLHTPIHPSYHWPQSHLWAAAPGPGQKSLHMWSGSRVFADFPVCLGPVFSGAWYFHLLTLAPLGVCTFSLHSNLLFLWEPIHRGLVPPSKSRNVVGGCLKVSYEGYFKMIIIGLDWSGG